MKFIKYFSIAVVLLVALVVGVLALMPAKFALAQLGNRIGPLTVDAVSGTIWNGRAGSSVMNGESLGALGWKVDPISLLAMRVDADLRLDGSEFQGKTFASFSGGGGLLLRDTLLTMDAQKLQPAVDIPALQLRGRVELTLEEADLVGMFPRKLKGAARWQDAAVAGEAEAVLGTLSATFQTASDGAIIGVLQDEGGPLALDGQFRAALTGYEADAVLSARDGNPQVQKALGYIGEVQPDGSSVLQIRGRLLPLP